MKDIKKKANEEAVQVMKVLRSQNKLTPYGECTDNRILDFTNKEYIKEVCFHLYGESKEAKCKLKINFCGMCCDYHVGSKFFEKKKSCNMQCTNLINGNKRDYIDDKKKKTKRRRR